MVFFLCNTTTKKIHEHRGHSFIIDSWLSVIQITQLSGNVLIVAGSFSHTEGIVCCNGARGSESEASQLTSHRHVGLDLCLKTHCCSQTFFQSSYNILPIQPDKSNHRWQPVMAFVKSHKSENNTQDALSCIEYISHVEDRQLNGT